MATLLSSRQGPLGFIRRHRYFLNGWKLIAFGFALCVMLPLSVIFLSFAVPAQEIWRHLADHLLAELLTHTAVLAAGVLTGTFLLGVSLAWLTAVCDFPGRKIFTWALLMPLAMPTYVLAFVMLGLFDFAGPVQSFFRSWPMTAWVRFPEIRSAGGVITVMSLALYPYVYLTARSAFKTQGPRALEAAQALGYSRPAAFFKVALPMARPWIAAGLMLVLMETLADFGAVSIFNFDTFTTAIYKAWYGFFSLTAAAQLSSLLVLIVFFVLMAEQRTRNRMRYTSSGRPVLQSDRIRLTGWSRWAAFLFVLAVMTMAFIVPFTQLVAWSLRIYAVELNQRYLMFLGHSIFFALSATVVINIGALVLAYTQRRYPDRITAILVRVSTLGYALPGTVLAVGIVIVVTFSDNVLAAFMRAVFGFESRALLQGTVFTVIAACTVRFMAAGFNTANSSLQRVTPHLDEAAISMGATGFSLLKRVHLPIIKNGILTAAMLVFVDVMKEMPITLMTRPFGWDTLAVKIFELTSEGEWERAALPAVVLVLAGLLPVIVMIKQIDKQ